MIQPMAIMKTKICAMKMPLNFESISLVFLPSSFPDEECEELLAVVLITPVTLRCSFGSTVDDLLEVPCTVFMAVLCCIMLAVDGFLEVV